MASHLVLVPGFGGFDALGSLRYYHGVTDVLQARDEERPVHYFPNLPTASVQTRARSLLTWMLELRRRGALGAGDDLHLVGHSTGGLDLRQFLIQLRKQPGTGANAHRPLVEQLRTVQFLSTPHQGTALAHRLSRSRPRVLASRLVLRLMYEGARGLRGKGLGLLGRALMPLSPRRKTADWIDAFIDTLVGCYSKEGAFQKASARGTYFDLLRWLLHMTSDFSAITDLDPAPASRAPPSPAHADDDEKEEEVAFLEAHGIRVRSIVTIATPARSWQPALFNLLHALTAFRPPRQLRRTHEVRELWTGTPWVLKPADNDGLVNCVSQVWPDEARSHLLQGDHADVIGHFRSAAPPPQADGAAFGFYQYDLLDSRSGFDEHRFTRLWEDIDRFTAVRPHRGVPRPRPREEIHLHPVRGGPEPLTDA